MKWKWNNGPEEWKPVRGWEGIYDVSSLGEVRSCCKSMKHYSVLLSQSLANGYPRVHLSRAGREETIHVHRLVAEAFLGCAPEGCNEVNHKDEDKTNNRADNLEWCDRKYNANYGTAQERRAASFRKTMAERKNAQHLR
ncbi:MAG: NUMOD4 motif-containing HNH endonuclease [Clostridia bacterium]|nr:NUMOD4 motif-containing HNH endonuclease [Clostridia bacterium]